MSNPKRIAIFISGGGSNARVMIDRFQQHPEDGVEVVLLVSNKASAGGLLMAAERGIPSLVVKRADWATGEELIAALQAYRVDLIVLAGFLWLIPSYLVQAYPDKIVNIHPALLPKYGGKGMYGRHVHAAVKEAGDLDSGITIHYVNENYDEGNVIFQAAVRLDPDDSPEQIAARVLRLEHGNYWRIIRNL
ncbi:phosphoribosylglycinamide formyltransferase-1 [Lewinella aquimaris]|uniref:Phosphoribosylglycinamide formyltransferase n=1 Tax=Neolewinella aquimaris TaxID=1835722 RepID=A0A840EA86_9BACT|nr:phosphoribosylglycinamide formyltransferase [Neolewinella aquimaris]MBB4078938.1 phosphoribosylglycinamide formyltransferase-1 [Neolewinella aquimaris]